MELLKNYQSKLFPYAYNILGSAEDARDAIQDVVVKYVAAPKQDIENETNYLIKSVINQSINIKKRNKKKVGHAVWLPEPIATEKADDNMNRNEIISYSMLVLLEYLNPKQRAVFILKEAFDYSHDEIAHILSLSIENSRKLLSRAKNELKKTNESFKTSSSHTSAFLQQYIQLIKNGDSKALAEMFSEEIAIKTDGGGKINIVSTLTIGIKPAADLMLYVYMTYQQLLSIRLGTVNHQPALLFYEGNTLINCQIFEFENRETKIKQIYSIVDPDKLKNIDKI